MNAESITISPSTRTAILDLAARTGRPAAEVLALAVEELRQRVIANGPIHDIPGVDPAQVWEAAAEADAGRLTPHAEVFARLRAGLSN